MSQTFKKGGVALITGGASGIGLSLAELCHVHNMRVVIVDKNADALSEARALFMGAFTTLQADVSREEDWEAVRLVVEEKFDGEFPLFRAFIEFPSTFVIANVPNVRLWKHRPTRLPRTKRRHGDQGSLG